MKDKLKKVYLILKKYFLEGIRFFYFIGYEIWTLIVALVTKIKEDEKRAKEEVEFAMKYYDYKDKSISWVSLVFIFAIGVFGFCFLLLECSK
jgi:hypothetical protein